MTGKRERYTRIAKSLVCQVWLMQEQDDRCSGWRLIESKLQIGVSDPTIVHPSQVKDRVPNADCQTLIV
jgi:hypothetical protein